MVQIEVDYRGELRARAVHAPSATELLTDAPVDNHGRGESFSPTDLVATALGTCMLTIMGVEAERHGWDLEGASASVKKKMQPEPRRIRELEVVIRVPVDLDGASRALLEGAAHSCPVHTTLAGNVEMPVRFEWGVSEPVTG